jgi:hypothetical protein
MAPYIDSNIVLGKRIHPGRPRQSAKMKNQRASALISLQISGPNGCSKTALPPECGPFRALLISSDIHIGSVTENLRGFIN